MPELQTLKEYLRYEPEEGAFYWLKRSSYKSKPGQRAGRPRSKVGYWQVTVLGKTYYAHRLAWAFSYGAWPELQIDHRNGIKGDNRISNLRQASGTMNAANVGAKRDNTSGCKNVHWCNTKQRWVAKIKKSGKTHHVGYYTNFDAAVEAVAAARVKVFGEFASQLGCDQSRDTAMVAFQFRRANAGS